MDTKPNASPGGILHKLSKLIAFFVLSILILGLNDPLLMLKHCNAYPIDDHPRVHSLEFSEPFKTDPHFSPSETDSTSKWGQNSKRDAPIISEELLLENDVQALQISELSQANSPSVVTTTKISWRNALMGALFGCSMFFLVFILIISLLASIRAIDYYILGRKDIRKQLLNGEYDDGGPFWKLFSSWRPNGKPGQSQPSPKPQFWKAQMFHVVDYKGIAAGGRANSMRGGAKTSTCDMRTMGGQFRSNCRTSNIFV